jgi:flagellar assembly protein FliH
MSFLLVSRAKTGDAAKPNGAPPARASETAVALDEEAMRAEIAREVAAEVARLRARAEAEGRAQGEAEARVALEAEAQALRQAVAALTDSARQLAAPLADKELDLADLVMDLAFELARHVIGVEVASSPASLRTLVTRLIQEAAIERGPKQSIVVRLNPEDHAVIEPMLMADNAHLLADSAIAQGGALVEIIAPNGDPIDKTEWDATIDSRMATMRAALALGGKEAAP